MFDILIFAGTTEGRELAEFCAVSGIGAYVSAATETGAAAIGKSPYLRVITGRKTREESERFIEENNIALVIDATHPYAREATENIRAACKTAKYIRVLREASEKCGGALYFDGADEIAEYLNENGGNVLITTGSKDLAKYTAVRNYGKRCFVRILAADGIIKNCVRLGFDAKKIISARGPFSVEENIRHLRLSGAEYLATKDSGKAGGFYEKIDAAKICGAIPLIIRRPAETGVTVREAEEILINGRKK